MLRIQKIVKGKFKCFPYWNKNVCIKIFCIEIMPWRRDFIWRRPSRHQTRTFTNYGLLQQLLWNAIDKIRNKPLFFCRFLFSSYRQSYHSSYEAIRMPNIKSITIYVLNENLDFQVFNWVNNERVFMCGMRTQYVFGLYDIRF